MHPVHRVRAKEERPTDTPNLHPIDQLENIHANQQLRTHNQDIPQRHPAPPGVRIIEHGIPKGHIDERIHGRHQYYQLGGPSNMMVDKAPAIGLIQVCISGAVEAFEQEGFDDVLFYQE